MSKTIIFMSGILLPNWLAKTKFLWDLPYWKDYNCVWIESKIPQSDVMVKRELDRLQNILEKYPNAIVAGQSLGAWWASNLACRPHCHFKKMVLWTPLVNANSYSFLNVSERYHPCKQAANPNIIGLFKTLVIYSAKDLVVPYHLHARHVIHHFNASSFTLNGGHVFQKNHQDALEYMKHWIESQ